MEDKLLEDLTLATWAAKVWQKARRGVPLQPAEGALAACMEQHAEWKNFFNRLVSGAVNNDGIGTSILIHIYNDAAVMLQLNRDSPSEISGLFRAMRARRFSQIDALHVLASAMHDQTWSARDSGGPFDLRQYVERAKRHVDAALEVPGFKQSLDLPEIPSLPETSGST